MLFLLPLDRIIDCANFFYIWFLPIGEGFLLFFLSNDFSLPFLPIGEGFLLFFLSNDFSLPFLPGKLIPWIMRGISSS